MDSITSGILLSAAMNGADNDRIADQVFEYDCDGFKLIEE